MLCYDTCIKSVTLRATPAIDNNNNNNNNNNNRDLREFNTNCESACCVVIKNRTLVGCCDCTFKETETKTQTVEHLDLFRTTFK